MKLVLKYALFISSFSIIWKLSLFIANAQNTVLGKYYLFAYFLFILVGILFGLKEYIKKHPEGTSIGEKIKVGMKISGLNALLYSAFIFLYYRWIDISFFASKINKDLLLMKSRNNSPSEIEQYLNTVKILYSPSSLFQATLFGFLLIGIIYSILCSLALHKRWIKL